MSMKKIAMLLALALTGAAIFAGCGSDDSSSDSAEAPTKAEFITQADEICQDSIDTITSESEKQLDEKSGDEEVLAFAEDTYIPELNSEVEDLQALTPPEGDEETVDEMFSSLEDGVNEISDDPNIVLEGGESPLADATEKAQAYGLKVCGTS